jgi:hypothetical protein
VADLLSNALVGFAKKSTDTSSLKFLKTMEKVTISAHISDKKRAEFFHTMESLKTIIEKSCKDLEVKISDNNRLVIQIVFEDREELESKFYNNEFNILKGSVRSVCDDVSIKVDDNILK